MAREIYTGIQSWSNVSPDTLAGYMRKGRVCQDMAENSTIDTVKHALFVMACAYFELAANEDTLRNQQDLRIINTQRCALHASYPHTAAFVDGELGIQYWQ